MNVYVEKKIIIKNVLLLIFWGSLLFQCIDAGAQNTPVNCPSDVEITTNSPLCEGVTLRLSTPIISGATWHWKGPNNFSQAERKAAKYATTLADSGIYALSLQIPGCPTLEKKIRIQINPFPKSPKLPASQNFCIGDTLFLLPPTIPHAAYEWSGPNGFTSKEPGLYLPNLTRNNAGLYQLSILKDGCFSVPASFRAIVHPRPPLPDFQHNAPICVGETLNLTGPLLAEVEYEWKGPQKLNATTRTVQIPMAKLENGGEYILRVQKNGCYSPEKRKIIEILPLPGDIAIAGAEAICDNQPLELRAKAEHPKTEFFWRGPNGFTSSGAQLRREGKKKQLEGDYEVVGAIGKCKSEVVRRTIQVNAAPLPIIAVANSPICEGETLFFTAITLEKDIALAWKGPLDFAAQEQNLNLKNAKVSASGVYTLSVQNNHCSAQPLKIPVTVIELPPPPSPQTNAPVCENDNLLLSAPAYSGVEYLWRGPANFTGYGASIEVPGIRKESEGVYYLTAQNSRYHHCKRDTHLFVTIKPEPVISYLKTNAPLCINETLQLSAPPLENARFEWKAPNGRKESGPEIQIPKASSQNAGIYTLIAVVEGCSSSPKNVEVKLLPCGIQCLAPEEIRVEEVWAEKARIRFIPRSSAIKAYIFSYGPLAQNPERWESLIIPEAEHALELTHLRPSTNYGVRVRSNCSLFSKRSGERSHWSPIFAFQTRESDADLRAREKTENAGCAVYPNPFYETLKITFNRDWKGKIAFTLYDKAGKTIKQSEIFLPQENQLAEIQLSDIEPGTYTLELKKEGQLLRFTLLKIEN
jgi:hypothetical protein